MLYETDHHPCDGPLACEPTHARSATSTFIEQRHPMLSNNWPAAFGGCRPVAFVLRICSVRILRLPGCTHPLALHQRAVQPPTSKTTRPSWNHLRPHCDLTLELQIASIKNHTSSCSMLPMKQKHTSCTLLEWMTCFRHCNGKLQHNHGQHLNSIQTPTLEAS